MAKSLDVWCFHVELVQKKIVMMHCSLHQTSTTRIQMKFDGPHWRMGLPQVHICKELPQCIRFIDGTLIKIHNPYWNEAYHTWFKGWKKIYAMNKIIILNHHGLFIYIDIGSPILIMMWISYDIQMCTKIDINISHMEMNILNTFPKIWVMHVKKCLYVHERTIQVSFRC